MASKRRVFVVWDATVGTVQMKWCRYVVSSLRQVEDNKTRSICCVFVVLGQKTGENGSKMRKEDDGGDGGQNGVDSSCNWHCQNTNVPSTERLATSKSQSNGVDIWCLRISGCEQE